MTSIDNTSDSGLSALAESLSRVIPPGERIATAESCTGGYIAQLLTSLAGSSAWFECGYVTYSNAAKMRDLGVDASDINLHGAVSEQVAGAMASGALNRAGVWAALSVTGVAGPGGGSVDKPVGTVCFGWAFLSHGVTTQRIVFSGDRDQVRRSTVAHAIAGLMSAAPA